MDITSMHSTTLNLSPHSTPHTHSAYPLRIPTPHSALPRQLSYPRLLYCSQKLHYPKPSHFRVRALVPSFYSHSTVSVVQDTLGRLVCAASIHTSNRSQTVQQSRFAIPDQLNTYKQTNNHRLFPLQSTPLPPPSPPNVNPTT